MESDGGLWRGCGFQVVYVGVGETYTIVLSWPRSASAPTTTCTSPDPSQSKLTLLLPMVEGPGAEPTSRASSAGDVAAGS
jgi:hypothetical protein